MIKYKKCTISNKDENWYSFLFCLNLSIHLDWLLAALSTYINNNSIPFNFVQFHSIPLNSIQFHSIPFNSTIPFNFIQFNSIQFNSIQFNSIQFNSIQINSIQFNSIQFNSIHFNSIQFNSIQFGSFWISRSGEWKVEVVGTTLVGVLLLVSLSIGVLLYCKYSESGSYHLQVSLLSFSSLLSLLSMLSLLSSF